MLQADEPDDYVLATGTSYTVRDFLHFCFDSVGLDWRKHVKYDERYLRPAEVDSLVGDASKAKRELGLASCCPGAGVGRHHDSGRGGNAVWLDEIGRWPRQASAASLTSLRVGTSRDQQRVTCVTTTMSRTPSKVIARSPVTTMPLAL
jgi:hypothetical protein